MNPLPISCCAGVFNWFFDIGHCPGTFFACSRNDKDGWREMGDGMLGEVTDRSRFFMQAAQRVCLRAEEFSRWRGTGTGG